MAKALSVKVATTKVINSLENKLAEIKTNYTNQEAKEAEYQKAFSDWQKQLQDYAIANVKKATNFRTSYRSWNNNLNIDFDVDTKGTDFPAEPTRDFEQIAPYQYKEMVEEISNAIRILKMTDEEVVNATTFKSIAQYL